MVTLVRDEDCKRHMVVTLGSDEDYIMVTTASDEDYMVVTLASDEDYAMITTASEEEAYGACSSNRCVEAKSQLSNPWLQNLSRVGVVANIVCAVSKKIIAFPNMLVVAPLEAQTAAPSVRCHLKLRHQSFMLAMTSRDVSRLRAH
ncbi:hypothetical protein PoB_000521800 [Plakobranchus ocellatus]|uniref:Uncharacterized protein n=1 Tax=Plakobranchus ocellatus TaxID=259542 RepID=A0AAV3Y973_9GAST|nr:hypothetical protein PoB_000521800 [Plakobranchus ocellatus]